MTMIAPPNDASLFESSERDASFSIPFSDVGRQIERWKKQRDEEMPQIAETVAYQEAMNKLRQTILDFLDDGLEMNDESIAVACEFLRKLSRYPDLLNAVSISADPEGKTVLRWKSEKSGKKGVVSMSVGKNRVLCYASTIEGEEAHGKEFFDEKIPSAIGQTLLKLNAH